MIEFTGSLSDDTLKFYHKRFLKELQGNYIFFFVFGMPMSIFLLHFIIPLKHILCIVLPILAVVAVFAPYLIVKVSKDRFAPKRITINDGLVLLVTDNLTDSRKIEQVKKVKDYGEYYALTLSGFGYYSSHFICQKNLLTKGSIDEFEALFEGKIKKMPQKK